MHDLLSTLSVGKLCFFLAVVYAHGQLYIA